MEKDKGKDKKTKRQIDKERDLSFCLFASAISWCAC